ANYIDKATSAVGLHEWTLNHLREGDEFPLDNRTTREFMSLLGDAPEISSRLRAARAHHTLLKRDVVECNSYVKSVSKMLQQNIPDAEMLCLSFKKMVSNKDYLKEELFKIGIVVHPLLVEEMNVSTIE
ncbi:MAG: hypothetical protein HOI88_04160, partial [Phycisphaerae bacterium]|nr:hypothetical protein [Phycisphaerae bacterium]